MGFSTGLQELAATRAERREALLGGYHFDLDALSPAPPAAATRRLPGPVAWTADGRAGARAACRVNASILFEASTGSGDDKTLTSNLFPERPAKGLCRSAFRGP